MLTEIAVRKLTPRGSQRIELWDEKLPGFGVRVSPTGTKSFVLMYYASGRKRRLTLGRYPLVSLGEARRRALDALTRVAGGDDPGESPNGDDRDFSFAKIVDDFVLMHCARHNRANHAHETARLLRARFVKAWTNRDIRQIDRANVLRVLDDAVASGAPSAANHALAAVRKLFNWSVERGIITVSPCAGITRPAPAVSRDRVLSEHEIAVIWKGASVTPYPFGAIVQLLLLTAQRRGEVADMRWADLDLDKALWTIPAQRTKSNRTHIVPLSSLAMRTILSIPRIDGVRVFPARSGNGTFQGFSKSKQRLDDACDVRGWTIHDLRRSAATHLAGLGAPPHVIERLLNHTSGTFRGVAGIYNRFGYLDEMREAVETWAQQIQTLAERAQSLNAPRANTLDVR